MLLIVWRGNLLSRTIVFEHVWRLMGGVDAVDGGGSRVPVFADDLMNFLIRSLVRDYDIDQETLFSFMFLFLSFWCGNGFIPRRSCLRSNLFSLSISNLRKEE